LIALLARSASQARYLMLGSMTLLWAFQIVIIGQSAEIERASSFGRMADLLPGFLQRGLGSKALILATFKGMVAFGYFHPVVCILVAGMAMYLATEPAHEVESGLVDVELARSMPRHRLLTRSILLALAALLAAAGVMALGTWMGARFFGAGGLDLPSPGVRVRLLGNLVALGSCLAGFALLVATLSRRWMTAFTTVMLTAVIAYMVDFLAIGWRPMETIAWLSPFHYYRALSIVAGDAPIGRDIAVLLGAATMLIATAYWQFDRRDL
jgi:ABC-type transport system involved in multi-copper enzyme maturation permease subunit